jgi:flagellar biosynthesis/type III secretory pathway chaperone
MSAASETAANDSADLLANLQQQHALMLQLADILETENRLLAGDEIESLEQLTTEKAAVAETLRALGTALTRRHGQQAEALPAWLAAQADGLALGERWQALLALAARCQQRNSANAAILDARHRQVRGKLQVLRGDPSPSVYGKGTANKGYGGIGTFSARSFGLA